MILDRKTDINLPDFKDAYSHLLDSTDKSDPVDAFLQLVELQQVCRAAMSEISTKLEILDDEFQIRHKHNPIHHMERRLKSPRSIVEKLKRKNLPADFTVAKNHLHDIAGVRVICNYIEDIYTVENLLSRQTDIALIRRNDYIKNPKENGYRSLHVVMTVPVFLSDRTETVPVEIQIRTIAMDMWASLEHKLRYKNGDLDVSMYTEQLRQCAEHLTQVEETMQDIHTRIS